MLTVKAESIDYFHNLEKKKEKISTNYLTNTILKAQAAQIRAPTSKFPCKLTAARSWNVNWDLITLIEQKL